MERKKVQLQIEAEVRPAALSKLDSLAVLLHGKIAKTFTSASAGPL
jgi:hypothetical protein